jgi:hypothetical protein
VSVRQVKAGRLRLPARGWLLTAGRAAELTLAFITTSPWFIRLANRSTAATAFWLAGRRDWGRPAGSWSGMLEGLPAGEYA